MVHTSGNGGETIEKRFQVTTNDPQTPGAQLIVTGKVNPLIKVSPPFVRIIGHAGQQLTASVQLQPVPDHPFTILDAKAWRNGDLGIDVRPLGNDPAQTGYQLLVRNLQTDPGVYRNYILIQTDLKEKAGLNIPVYVRIYSPGEEVESEPSQ